MTMHVRTMRWMVSRPFVVDESGVTNVVGVKLLLVTGNKVVDGVIGSCN